jgi:hypothetical protein
LGEETASQAAAAATAITATTTATATTATTTTPDEIATADEIAAAATVASAKKNTEDMEQALNKLLAEAAADELKTAQGQVPEEPPEEDAAADEGPFVGTDGSCHHYF